MPDVFIKDPDAKLDYQVNWATWLVSDTISTSDWIVPTGITEMDDPTHPTANTTTTATIWLSGGTIGKQYEVVNRIVTAGGRTKDHTIIIRVEAQ